MIFSLVVEYIVKVTVKYICNDSFIIPTKEKIVIVSFFFLVGVMVEYMLKDIANYIWKDSFINGRLYCERYSEIYMERQINLSFNTW